MTFLSNFASLKMVKERNKTLVRITTYMINLQQSVARFNSRSIVSCTTRPHVRHHQRLSIQGSAVQHQISSWSRVLRQTPSDGNTERAPYLLHGDFG